MKNVAIKIQYTAPLDSVLHFGYDGNHILVIAVFRKDL